MLCFMMMIIVIVALFSPIGFGAIGTGWKELEWKTMVCFTLKRQADGRAGGPRGEQRKQPGQILVISD